jgi:hypothetical protein
MSNANSIYKNFYHCHDTGKVLVNATGITHVQALSKTCMLQ